jgi:excinuclease UvrABC helicase subunit UvrB/very-short-patch-repair endonuclease
MITRNTDTKFKVVSEWPPAGDQPKAIEEIVNVLDNEYREKSSTQKKKVTLLGVTGSGKTFTVANVIEKLQKTTLVIAHNKTLAAQLAQEFKQFFPNNKVHYFVSYYDYYQPEAYVSATDTYIEKDASINEEIDRLRHASTQSLLTRQDTIIVASVSCIYGLGSPEEYKKENLILSVGEEYTKQSIMEALVKVHFERTNADLKSGTFRAVGNRVDVQPMSETWMASIFFSAGKISMIQVLDPVSMRILENTDSVMFFPAKHFLTDEKTMSRAILEIQKECEQQVKMFEKAGKLLEADRIKRRTMQDVAMMREVGYCPGIENYSRILAGKKVGEAPETLLSYFPHDHKGNPEFLTVIDESHVTLPQLHGMYAGDRARKENLIKFGFRLPSALDNRPLQYNEFEERVGDMLFVSATPGKFELAESNKVVEQIIRPTGLIDPVLEVKPVLPKKASPLTPLQGRGEEVQTHRTADLKHYDGLKLKVKEMRQNPTKAEELLWKHLRGDKFDIRFRRQIIIDNFIVDFVNLEKKLIIEVDGGIHDKQKERDEARTQILENLGYKVLRFNNSEVLDDLQNVLEKIKLELVPLSNGEGPGVRLSKEEVNYPGQIADFIMETEKAVKKGGRVIATTLTKKMAEDLSQFLRDRKIKAEYLHSDIKTIDRIQILTKFRRGEFDCLVGVNLLREGLDLPEVSLIGILDADKEGFLRSETSLIQTIGRAARNVDGKVILYADVMTGSLERAISETNRRRKLQQEHNQKHGITPKTIIKSINDITAGIETIKKKTAHEEAMLEMKLSGKKVSTLLKQKEKEMLVAAKELDFETAAILRDEIKELEKMLEASKDKSDK